MLPIWIGKELFMILFGGESQIAYVAHLGGLLSGAILGFLNLKVFGWINEDVGREDPKEQIPELLEQAYSYIEKVDMKNARFPLEKILEIDPGHTQALTSLYNIDKLNPDEDSFHKTAARFLLHLNRQNDADELYKIYKEICKLNKNPKLSKSLIYSFYINTWRFIYLTITGTF